MLYQRWHGWHGHFDAVKVHALLFYRVGGEIQLEWQWYLCVVWNRRHDSSGECRGGYSQGRHTSASHCHSVPCLLRIRRIYPCQQIQLSPELKNGHTCITFSGFKSSWERIMNFPWCFGCFTSRLRILLCRKKETVAFVESSHSLQSMPLWVMFCRCHCILVCY